VVDVGDFTQAADGLPRANWQVPWMECILDDEGKTLLSEPLDALDDPALWHGDVRLAFFFHHMDFGKPLMTPLGSIELPQPTPVPSRLSRIISYETP
jgi:hypothetical protein